MGKLSEMMKRFEKAMAASAFAEEGEFDTARKMMNEPIKTSGCCDAAGDGDIAEGTEMHSPAYGK